MGMAAVAHKTVPLGTVIQQRTEFIHIDDLQGYKRVRVQLHAKGIVQRDVVTGAEVKTKKQQSCRAAEFLVAEIDAKVGGFGIVPEVLDGAIVSSHYFLYQIDESALDRRFLDFFIRTPAFMEQVRAQGSTNYAAIRPGDVLNYTIPLPPLEEQRRIVARIEALAAKIEEARVMRDQARVGLDQIWCASARETLDTLASCPCRNIGEIVEIKGGGTPPKHDPLLWKGSVPWLAPKDMKSREIREAVFYISEDATRISSAKPIEPGAVLIVVRGMILAKNVPVAILKVPATINQDMKALIPMDGLSSEYLCHALLASNAALQGLVEKSTHDTRKLETDKLLDFRIPVPGLPEQRRIVAHLDNLQAKVDALKRLQAETAAELDALLPSILDKAFKGEL